LFYREWGAGRPIVFVHGWAVNCDVWQYQLMALSTHTRCIAYDKRGHGRSTDPGSGYDYDTLADDLACVLEDLNLTDVVLVGHSMGPAEIVRYLTRHGDARISRLVLISPALPFMLKTPDNPGGIDGAIFQNRRQQWSQDLPRFLAENARSIVMGETSAETVAWIAGMGLQAAPKALFDLNHAITETDLRADVGRVRLPTLIIHGSEDKSAPVALTSRVLARIVAQSELRIYDGAPHCLLVTHQSLLNADLDAWVRQ
jgi:pimeloyl-ACP methyl ester carboxylesterase